MYYSVFKLMVNVVMPLNSRNDLSSSYSFLEHVEQSIHLTFNIPSSELMKRSDVKKLLNSTVLFHCSCYLFYAWIIKSTYNTDHLTNTAWINACFLKVGPKSLSFLSQWDDLPSLFSLCYLDINLCPPVGDKIVNFFLSVYVW